MRLKKRYKREWVRKQKSERERKDERQVKQSAVESDGNKRRKKNLKRGKKKIGGMASR